MVQNKDSPRSDVPAGAIDPYALVEALIGRKIDRLSMVSAPATSDLQDVDDDIVEVKHGRTLSPEGPKPDEPPHSVHVGCINPYALVEALIGRKIDWNSTTSAPILSHVLQTDYDELFDLKYSSLLYAGLKLNEKDRKAEKLSDKDIQILNERDLETPDLSQVKEAGDLQKLGMKDLLRSRVKTARAQNGKLHLVLEAHDMGKTLNNREITMSINELALPFRMHKGEWTPPNSSWRDPPHHDLGGRLGTALDRFHIGQGLTMGKGLLGGTSVSRTFDDPVQGSVGNSWLIAAIFSVFWADPSMINRNAHSSDQLPHDKDKDEKHPVLTIKFFDKGGENNAPTAMVEVNHEIPINNSDKQFVYCRASDGQTIWPSLYEKGFAKWITRSKSDHPDVTHTYAGDPIKAMAQINDKKPQYYFTDRRNANELVGLVRTFSVNYRTINPICAYTHATGSRYRGSNLVANHAYSVLGWANNGSQYIILRNPFGVTEPLGLTSYPGVLDRFEPEFWPPAAFLDRGGVFAVEATAFKEYFACIGVAK